MSFDSEHLTNATDEFIWPTDILYMSVDAEHLTIATDEFIWPTGILYRLLMLDI